MAPTPITITSSDSAERSDNAVAEAFGSINSTTPIAARRPSTARVRTELEEQYNVLLTQINDLAEDASFNGVNLLDGNDLNVIFNEDALVPAGHPGRGRSMRQASVCRRCRPTISRRTPTSNPPRLAQDADDTLRSQASTFGSNLSRGGRPARTSPRR